MTEKLNVQTLNDHAKCCTDTKQVQNSEFGMKSSQRPYFRSGSGGSSDSGGGGGDGAASCFYTYCSRCYLFLFTCF